MSTEADVVNKVAGDASALWTILQWLWGGLVTVASAFGYFVFSSFKDDLNRVKSMTENKVDQTDFDDHRREIREDVIRLHKKVEMMGGDINKKIDESIRDAQDRHQDIMNHLLKIGS